MVLRVLAVGPFRTPATRALAWPGEEIRGEGNVELEGAHATREHREPRRMYNRGERHLETVHASVVGELLLYRLASRRARRRVVALSDDADRSPDRATAQPPASLRRRRQEPSDRGPVRRRREGASREPCHRRAQAATRRRRAARCRASDRLRPRAADRRPRSSFTQHSPPSNTPDDRTGRRF